LRYSESQRLLVCRGVEGLEAGVEKVVGGWVCNNNGDCPFPKSGLTKMILDLYTTSRTMFLVGAEHDDGFRSPISAFIRNGGTLPHPL